MQSMNFSVASLLGVVAFTGGCMCCHHQRDSVLGEVTFSLIVAALLLLSSALFTAVKGTERFGWGFSFSAAAICC